MMGVDVTVTRQLFATCRCKNISWDMQCSLLWESHKTPQLHLSCDNQGDVNPYSWMIYISLYLMQPLMHEEPCEKTKMNPFTSLCWPKRGLEYVGMFVWAFRVQRYFPACDPAVAAAWNEWCMFVNELLCEWKSVTAGLTASHNDSGLGGLCDAVMLHIKKGPIEICSGSFKGYHGDHSTSTNNKTGGPS